MILINETPVRQGDQYVTAYEAEATTGAVEYTFPELQATLTIFNFGLRGVIAVANGERKVIDPNDSESFKHTSSVTIHTLVGAQRFRLEGRKQVEQIVAGTVDNVAREIAAAKLDTTVFNTELTAINNQFASSETELDLKGVSAQKLGLKGDGTDETAALKAAIEYVADNHLQLEIPKDMTILVNYMIISNKSNFSIKCDGTIKRLNNAPTTASIIRFDVCSKIHFLNLNFDGNALNNGCVENVAYTVNQEQRHTLAFTACTDITIDRFYVLNPCGDGIYISVNSKNINIDKIIGKADSRIGRNILSIINAQNIFVNHINSDGIGHYDMPGGLDIEPNGAAEVVRNVFINNINIRSGGSNILSVLNTNGATVENIFIDKASIVSDSVVSTNPSCSILAGQNVTINQLVMDGGGKADLIKVDTWDSNSATTKNVTIRKAIGKNGYRGISLGFNRQVTHVDISAVFTNILFDGVAMYWCKDVRLNLNIDSVKSDRFMVNSSPATGTVENIYITGDISKRGTGLKAIISTGDPLKNINWTLDNLNFTGWGVGDKLFGAGLQTSIRKMNCPNLTQMTSIPSGSETQWRQGDIVWNIGTSNTVAYWRRLTNGTGNVLDTDWKAY